jgi:predicted metalloprotease with PDZ domain
LQEDYFHFIGEGFFVHPDWDDERPRLIAFRWNNLPKGWKLSHSFGTGQRDQIINKSLSQLRRAVYVGGDFRVKKILVKGRRLYVALRGRWNFPDQAFFDLAKTVVEVQRGFWKDYDFPYFLITLIPTSQPRCSYGGTGLTDSFATFISTDKPIDLSLKHLLAHELFHTWNGVKIPPRQPEELLYWFTEGFTDYYTRLLLLRAGLITLEEYFDDYNKAIFDYYTSPFREVGNRRILKRYWHDDETRRIPYRRGDIIAHNWNARIRTASRGCHSLDDVMTDLFQAAREKGALVSATLVSKLIRAYLKRGVQDDIKKHIDSGALVSPDKSALGPVAELKITEISKFDLGFEFAESASQRYVDAVREGSAAFRAGLREGQQILEARVFHGDPAQMAQLRIKDSRGQRLVKFYPVGEKLRVPQYVFPRRMSKKELAGCRSWFGL